MAESAVRDLVQKNPSLDDRIELVAGDITLPDLGLGARRKEIAEATVELYHLAAVYDLSVGRELAMRVNVDGTRHILDFCEACPKLERHQYVSTCYVSGRYQGRFNEADLETAGRFNNFYEETKHLAEMDVRRRMDHIPTSIYRPAIVVGDRDTGATQKFDGPYFALRFLLKQKGPIAVMPLVGRPREYSINVVPRDFVVDAIAYLSGIDASAGKTYQLADPDPLTVAEIIDEMRKAVGKRLIKVNLPASIAKGAIEHVPGVRQLFEFPPHVVDYFMHPTRYDTTNTTADLEGSGVSCPRFDTYLPNLARFVRDNPTIASDAMV